MNSFERFLAGKDAIARLICHQPAFEPSAEQEARLLAAIASLPQNLPETLEFEAPEHMEATFLQTMHAAQQAQAARRAALLDRLQHGAQPVVVLGHPISAATQDWLASQQIAFTEPAKAQRLATKMPWWQWSSMVLASALVTVIGMRWFFPTHPAPSIETAFNRSIPKSAITPQENAPLQMTEKIAPSPAENARVAQLAPAEPPRPATPPMLKKYTAPENVVLSPPPTITLAGRAPAADTPLQLALTDQLKTEPAEMAHTKGAEIVAAAPALLMDATQAKLAAAPPPPAAPAAKPLLQANKAAASTPQSRSIRLSENPVDVAHSLSSDWTGQALILQVVDPQSPAILDWVTRLKTALPPGTRLTLQQAQELDTNHVVLIRP